MEEETTHNIGDHYDQETKKYDFEGLTAALAFSPDLIILLGPEVATQVRGAIWNSGFLQALVAHVKENAT